MNSFSYAKPGSLDATVSTLANGQNAMAIGGGTNLLDLMKEKVAQPETLVDVNGVLSKEITPLPDGGLRIGAGLTNAATAYHPLVQERFPLLSKAILAGATAQLRNMATNGGNLMQRTRCYYFYDRATPCNKREPGSGCSAINGYNRIHAILGWSDQCIAVHPSDMCVALAALEAKINVVGASGERVIPIAEFHRLPGSEPHIDNTLQPGEIITSIDLPPNDFTQYHTYLKARDRISYAFALVSVAVGLKIEGETITEARIALGGVAHKPWRSERAEGALVGKKACDAAFAEAAALLTEGAKGFEHNQFKVTLAKKAIIRALRDAIKSNAS